MRPSLASCLKCVLRTTAPIDKIVVIIIIYWPNEFEICVAAANWQCFVDGSRNEKGKWVLIKRQGFRIKLHTHAHTILYYSVYLCRSRPEWFNLGPKIIYHVCFAIWKWNEIKAQETNIYTKERGNGKICMTFCRILSDLIDGSWIDYRTKLICYAQWQEHVSINIILFCVLLFTKFNLFHHHPANHIASCVQNVRSWLRKLSRTSVLMLCPIRHSYALSCSHQLLIIVFLVSRSHHFFSIFWLIQETFRTVQGNLNVLI